MNAQRILVPIDFTPPSAAALDAATLLARGSGGKLLIAHVLEPNSNAEVLQDSYEFSRHLIADQAQKLESVVPTQPGVSHEHRLLTGTPVEAILHEAEIEKADVIVLGTHGRNGFAAALGSVAEAVVRRAKCPVLAVRGPVPSAVATA